MEERTNGADSSTNGGSANGSGSSANAAEHASLGEMPSPMMDASKTEQTRSTTPARGLMPGESSTGASRGMAPDMGSFGGEQAGTDQPPSGGTRGLGDGDLQQVLVELRAPQTRGLDDPQEIVASMAMPGFQVDPSYDPVPIPVTDGPLGESRSLDQQETVIVRGTIERSRIAELEAQPDVVRVYLDTIVMPFVTAVEEQQALVAPQEVAMATCPIGTCDCAPGTAKGTIADVANYLGVNHIWSAGYRGEGIVVGVVDGGITAIGRTPKPGETAKIPRVIGGFPADWGTTAAAWGDHGNMCSTDVLGMAPQAQIYDIRIGGTIAATISSALAGFQWAINQHRSNGTPHILTNSWGIFQENWDSVYARDPSHPFTRKVVEAINEGIIVLFAAGNCGGTCPDGRCGSDSGPGRSIWGANGHPRVITVGAVNKNEQFVGYSSQGPAALDPQKPDFCSITHFKGYFASDSGTSAATPIAAGVVALLKQANAGATQDQIKASLKGTAKDIGPGGFDQHSGAGIIRPKLAFDQLVQSWHGWENLGGYCIYDPAVATWAANRLDTFVIGSDNAMWHKWWDGSTWQGWENLGGYCTSGPSAVSWGTNRIDTFVIGLDHAMWHKWWDGSAWHGWENLGGFCVYGTAAASWAANRLDTFVIGSDGAMWHKWWDGSTWQGWENLGGYCISAPAAVSWGPNRIDTFVIGTDHALWHKWWDGSAWHGWENLGGFCIASPAVASWSNNRLDVFVIGSDNATYRKYWNGSTWSGWESLGGIAISAPAAASWGPNRIDTFVIGTDHAMWHKWYA